jgi:predicted ABC-type ATPase
MPRLIVYAGPNGAGKSTLREAGDDQIEIVIDPDRIAKGLSGRAPEQLQIEAGRLALTLFKTSLADGKSISLETTLSGHTVLQRILAAKQTGYDIELRFVALASPELHIMRVRQRVLKGGHDIPPATIARRYAQSLENLPKVVGFCNKINILDNSGAERRFLLRAENGVVLTLDPNPPAWFAALLPAIHAVLGAP